MMVKPVSMTMENPMGLVKWTSCYVARIANVKTSAVKVSSKQILKLKMTRDGVCNKNLRYLQWMHIII